MKHARNYAKRLPSLSAALYYHRRAWQQSGECEWQLCEQDPPRAALGVGGQLCQDGLWNCEIANTLTCLDFSVVCSVCLCICSVCMRVCVYITTVECDVLCWKLGMCKCLFVSKSICRKTESGSWMNWRLYSISPEAFSPTQRVCMYYCVARRKMDNRCVFILWCLHIQSSYFLFLFTYIEIALCIYIVIFLQMLDYRVSVQTTVTCSRERSRRASTSTAATARPTSLETTVVQCARTAVRVPVWTTLVPLCTWRSRSSMSSKTLPKLTVSPYFYI